MPRGRATDVDKTGQYGKFRERRLKDPYIPFKGWKEPTVCPICSALYLKKRWQFNDNLLYDLKQKKEIFSHKCPACRKIEDNYPMGIIDISGKFVSEHRDELVNLIRSEERHAKEKNPLERIMKMEKKNGGIHVEVTCESLALRIARILKRAYKGEHEYSLSDGDKYITIVWRRD